MALKFAVCIEKDDLGDFSGDDISPGRLYEVIETDAGNGMTRVIDDSGEDYLYPASWFEPVTLPESAAFRLHDALNPRKESSRSG